MKKELLALLLIYMLAACNNSGESQNKEKDAPSDVDYPTTEFPPDTAAPVSDSGRKVYQRDSLKDTLSVRFPDKKQ